MLSVRLSVLTPLLSPFEVVFRVSLIFVWMFHHWRPKQRHNFKTSHSQYEYHEGCANLRLQCAFWCLRSDVPEDCILLGCNVASVGNHKPTFRSNVRCSSSDVDRFSLGRRDSITHLRSVVSKKERNSPNRFYLAIKAIERAIYVEWHQFKRDIDICSV